MITDSKVMLNQKLLLYLIAAIGFIFLFANLVNQEEFPIADGWYATDILYIIVPATAIVFGTILCTKYKGQGNHGKAWIFLTLAMVSWFTAELLWEYEVESELDELYSLTSELFFIVGYPLFFAFTLFYLKPRRRVITKKIVLSSVIASLILVIPSIYISFDLEDEGLEFADVFLVALYPILDGIILAPALIGITLFFKGQVNLLWTLLMIGLLCDVVGDTLFLGSYIDDSYYPGHVSDIFFVWSYLLFAFGFYSHVRLFKKESYHQKIN